MELQKSDKAALEAAETPYCRYDVFNHWQFRHRVTNNT
jgi:hypothetical protein